MCLKHIYMLNNVVIAKFYSHANFPSLFTAIMLA